MSVYQAFQQWLANINYLFDNGSYGTDSWDKVSGTSGADLILGYSGNDILKGFGGNDALYGGGGSDFLAGHRGDDFMVGGNGKDFLGGVYGNNVMFGGNGKDTFIFNTMQWKVEKGTDGFSSVIMDFEKNLDTITLYGTERTDYQVVQDGDDVVIETIWGNDIVTVVDAYAEDVCDAIDEHPLTWQEYQDNVNPFDFG